MPRSNDIFAANVLRFRTERRMSQNDVAKAAGVNATAVSHWETGRSIPKGKVLDRLEEALGCTLAELFTPGADVKLKPLSPLEHRPPTLAEALRVVNEHMSELVIKRRSRPGNGGGTPVQGS
jgi:transcriptional regulator with XRE-family HTH domain